MPQEDRPLRVLYVIGTARSGSTVLNTLLGSHHDVIGAGELGYLSEHGHAFREVCSCGVPATSCEFWSRVYAEWLRIGGPRSLEHYVALQRRFEQGRFRPVDPVPPIQKQTAAYVKYAALAAHLLEAIRRVSGKSIIVDSSKTPWRALVLASLPGIDVRVLHLVRHPAGVVWSMKKAAKGKETDQSPRSVVRSSLYWLILNLQARLVRRRLPASHSIRLRYEDLVRQPSETMNRIGALLDCDLAEIGRRAVLGESFRVEHTIAGNRLRMQGKVRLRMDSDWHDQLSLLDQSLCGALTGWLAKLYGYDRIVDRSAPNQMPASPLQDHR
jgi:sulfotransferase family protein